MEWQPIKTAPENTWVLVFAKDASVPDVCMLCQHGGEYGWCDPQEDEYVPDWEVTHWMPLPAPPPTVKD